MIDYEKVDGYFNEKIECYERILRLSDEWISLSDEESIEPIEEYVRERERAIKKIEMLDGLIEEEIGGEEVNSPIIEAQQERERGLILKITQHDSDIEEALKTKSDSVLKELKKIGLAKFAMQGYYQKRTKTPRFIDKVS